MERIEAAAILCALLFIIVFLVDYFFIKRKYLKKITGKKKVKKNKKINELTELTYLVSKFKLDKNNLNLNKLLFIISLINALIISVVAVIVLLIQINIIVQLIIGFILLLGLIYACYEILGRHLVKVESDK